jgi:serine protease Do
VKLTVQRDGREQTIEVTLAEARAATAGDDARSAPRDGTGFGMGVEPLTADRARQLGVDAAGVIVTSVQPSGRAADAGLRPGDVIVEVDRKPVASVDALSAALKNGDGPALLLVRRGEASIFLTLRRGDR